MTGKKIYKQHIKFAYELGGQTGELFNLYERGGENYICVEGQTGTGQIEARTSLCNARLNMLYPVAQIDRRYLTTSRALSKAIEYFVKNFHPCSFTFGATIVGRSDKGVFTGRVRTSCPESPLKGKVEKLTFDKSS